MRSRYQYRYTNSKTTGMDIEGGIRYSIQRHLPAWIRLSHNNIRYVPDTIYKTYHNRLYILKDSTLILPEAMQIDMMVSALGKNIARLILMKILDRFTKLLPVTILPSLDNDYLQQRFLTNKPIQVISANREELDSTTRVFPLPDDVEYPYHIMYKRHMDVYPMVYVHSNVDYYDIDDNQVAAVLKHSIVITDLLEQPKNYIRVPINKEEPKCPQE